MPIEMGYRTDTITEIPLAHISNEHPYGVGIIQCKLRIKYLIQYQLLDLHMTQLI